MCKIVVSLLLFALLLTAGCGAGDRDTALRANSNGADSTTSSLQEPPRQPRPDFTPSTVDPTIVDRNENRQDGSVGSLCWARWEIARSSVDGLGDDDHAERSVRLFIERSPAVESHLREISEALPADIRPFGERFSADLAGARQYASESEGVEPKERWDRIFNSFDFERYPGVKEYAEAAKQDPDCDTY